jgi:Arabinose-binding domain of AraC transcription regulator, N-term
MMNESQKTVIYSWLHVIAKTLESYGINPITFLKKWDLDYDISVPHEARIPTLKVFRAINHATRVCGDGAFGINLAKNIVPTMFHGLAIAAISSENLLSAIRLEKYCVESKYEYTRTAGPVTRRRQ